MVTGGGEEQGIGIVVCGYRVSFGVPGKVLEKDRW